jgi:hypothetical protein
VIHASYEVTDTVVDTETVSDYFVAHVIRNWELVKADPDWQQDMSSQPREFWYVRDGQQIYQSNLPLDTGNIHLNQLILDYEFPLSQGKSWCLLPDARGAGQSSGCDFVGKRQVTAYGPYTTPAGTFESCYDLTDSYNGGNILQKFCAGAGIVYMKFDHAGTRFGFEQTLSSLSPGTP